MNKLIIKLKVGKMPDSSVYVENEKMISSFVLGSLMTSYPGDYFREDLEALLEDNFVFDLFEKIAPESWKTVKEFLLEFCISVESVENLRSQYIDIFDRGSAVNSLYETEYGLGRPMVKGNELADIGGFYKAFGFEFGGEDSVHEMLDHVSVEFEFYALLKMKTEYLHRENDIEGVEIVTEARKKFLKEHLGRFIGAIGKRPGVAENIFYSSLFDCFLKLVEKECSLLGVEAETTEWLEPESAIGDITSGRTVSEDL
jgi:nitrate reductase assembly molybdenum cofactor insertion protein NarJ